MEVPEHGDIRSGIFSLQKPRYLEQKGGERF